jgi:hypothetical protein
MNDDFEKFLAKQPLRPIPPEWRAQILETATASEPAKPQPAKNEPSIPWWRALLWPSPVAWGSVACVWLLIIGMNIASRPSKGETVAIPAASSQDIFITILHERQLVQELFQPEKEPAAPSPKPDPTGACNDRFARRPKETA